MKSVSQACACTSRTAPSWSPTRKASTATAVCVPPRTTLKVDKSTLPSGSILVESSNRNALDPNSLFIDLKNGELHQADFIEGSCSPEVMEQTKARRAQGEVNAAQPNKPSTGPALIFDSKPSTIKPPVTPPPSLDGKPSGAAQ